MPILGPSIFLILRLGLKSLLIHKLRTGLAVLGIVIGVAAMIAMVAMGEGSKQEALEQIKRLGATNIIVRSVKPPDDSTSQTSRSFIVDYGLNGIDLERFLTVSTVYRALPIRRFPHEIHYLDKKPDGRVVGTTPMYAQVNKLTLARGRFLSDPDEEFIENVAVLGSHIAAAVFGYEDPMGKTVKLRNHYYTVVGVMAPRVPTAGTGGSQAAEDFNDDVYIPLSTCRARFGDIIFNAQAGSRSAEKVELHQITVSVRETSQVRPTAQILESLLRKYHKKQDWVMTVPLDLLEEAERTKMLFNVLLGSIAGVSLLVGGIGIMNIMLATVTERTREIGVRRALGAKRRDITMQFLIEALLLTGIGCLVGVPLGLVLPEAFAWIAEHAFKFPTNPQVNVWSLPVAVGVSMLIGIVFGLYPARRAALMDPIEALRHE